MCIGSISVLMFERLLLNSSMFLLLLGSLAVVKFLMTGWLQLID